MLVLQWLVKRMDVVSRQCIFVNPKFNIRRTIYIPEVARHTGLCERTVTRVMDSITRARYVIRNVVGKSNQRYHYYLSEALFRDLKLDISLRILTGKLKGLARKGELAAEKKKPTNQTRTQRPKHGPHASTGQASAIEADTTYGSLTIPDESQKAVGNAFLDKLRRRRPKSPG